jgi:hypothetical protein
MEDGGSHNIVHSCYNRRQLLYFIRCGSPGCQSTRKGMIALGTDSSRLFVVAIRWPSSARAFRSGPDMEVGVKSFSIWRLPFMPFGPSSIPNKLSPTIRIRSIAPNIWARTSDRVSPSSSRPSLGPTAKSLINCFSDYVRCLSNIFLL